MAKATQNSAKPAKAGKQPEQPVRFGDLNENEPFRACGETWKKFGTDWATHATDPDRGQLFFPQAMVERVDPDAEAE